MNSLVSATIAPGNTLSEKNSENGVLDIVKLVLSFFVVCIHTGVNTGSNIADLHLMQGLFRIAVPLFFFTAGYYLFSKIPYDKKLDKESEKKVLAYARRIFRMYVIWSLFYLVYQVYEWCKGGIKIKDIIIYLEYTLVRGDSYLHLWYLSSLFTGVFLVWLCRKFLSMSATLAVSAILFVAGLFLFPYYFIIRPVVESDSLLSFLYENYSRFIGSPRCGLFFGFIYVALGAVFACKKIKLKRTVSAAGIAVSAVAAFTELTLIDRNWSWESATYGALQLSHIPLVIFIFCFVNSFAGVNIPQGKTVRKLSTRVYLIHPAIIIVLRFFPDFYNALSQPFVKGITVFVISVAVSLLFVRLEKIRAFSFLKKLF